MQLLNQRKPREIKLSCNVKEKRVWQNKINEIFQKMHLRKLIAECHGKKLGNLNKILVDTARPL